MYYSRVTKRPCVVAQIMGVLLTAVAFLFGMLFLMGGIVSFIEETSAQVILMMCMGAIIMSLSLFGLHAQLYGQKPDTASHTHN